MTTAFKQGFMDKMAELNKAAAGFRFRLPEFRLPRLSLRSPEPPKVLLSERVAPEVPIQVGATRTGRNVPRTTAVADDGVGAVLHSSVGHRPLAEEVDGPVGSWIPDENLHESSLIVPKAHGFGAKKSPPLEELTPEDWQIFKARMLLNSERGQKIVSNPLFGKKLQELAMRPMSLEGRVGADGKYIEPRSDGGINGAVSSGPKELRDHRQSRGGWKTQSGTVDEVIPSDTHFNPPPLLAEEIAEFAKANPAGGGESLASRIAGIKIKDALVDRILNDKLLSARPAVAEEGAVKKTPSSLAALVR
jgi:hypothetical protein